MLMLVAAAVAATQPLPQARAPAVASAQAQATIRIISGERISFADAAPAAGKLVREVTLDKNGTSQPARLVEFQ